MGVCPGDRPGQEESAAPHAISGIDSIFAGTTGTNQENARNPLSLLNKFVPARCGDKRGDNGDSGDKPALFDNFTPTCPLSTTLSSNRPACTLAQHRAATNPRTGALGRTQAARPSEGDGRALLTHRARRHRLDLALELGPVARRTELHQPAHIQVTRSPYQGCLAAVRGSGGPMRAGCKKPA